MVNLIFTVVQLLHQPASEYECSPTLKSTRHSDIIRVYFASELYTFTVAVRINWNDGLEKSHLRTLQHLCEDSCER